MIDSLSDSVINILNMYLSNNEIGFSYLTGSDFKNTTQDFGVEMIYIINMYLPNGDI